MRVTQKKDISRFYEALLKRDVGYIKSFFVGVKTTGIFCISICRARKPKLENVEFFTELKDVLKHGFRPCKICKPTENVFETPSEVIAALSLVKKEPVRDFDLRQQGLSPETIRRWFKKNYGVTFQAYQRMLRINGAFQQLKKGDKVIETAFNSGYESLSGFTYTFHKTLGKSPSMIKHQNLILISRLDSPLGPMFCCATDHGVCLLEFTDRRMLETEFRDLQKRLSARIIFGENEHINGLKKELQEYFDGRRKTFSVKLHSPGTPFQQVVWSKLAEIPFGTTTSYSELAKQLKKSSAVRAVASANGHNRISILIPCHRVMGKNGHLTGYGGGLERKRWLLEHEKKGF